MRERAEVLAERASAGAKARQDSQVGIEERPPHATGANGHASDPANGSSARIDRSDALTPVPLGSFVKEAAEIDFIVDDVLRRGALYTLTGPTGSGKTGIAVALALNVASGTRFGMHECAAGPVLYIAGENPDDVRGRFVVALERMRLPQEAVDRIHIVARSFALAERTAELASMIETLGSILVISDTDQAISLEAGTDENSNVDRMAHAKRLRALTRVHSRPTLVDLCHPTKRPTSADDCIPRGGGSFLNEVDGNFRLWRDGEVADLTSDPNKFRGAPVAISFRLEIVTTDRLKDRKGRLVGLPYLAAISEDQAAAQARTQWTEENRLIYAMHADPKGSHAAWATSCAWVDGDGKPRKDKVSRLLRRLEKASPALVRQVRGGRWGLTTAGEKEAQKS